MFTRVGCWLGPMIALVVVIVDEMLQLGDKDRTFEWSDPVAGALGIMLATMVILIVQRRGRSGMGSGVPR